ncbi:MAG: tRNA (adenosine(37)-N6)-dimethylallyltransferase MiaA [Muribaculaceae bacterium]|nr:tRNA (adenosine(37)-N6)-dimethylallyltransferase MiaA [Muribaculaceae bacterium]
MTHFSPHSKPTLVVLTGPTASGKTAAAIALAQRLGCEIINADSRQIFKEIPICTAAPTAAEQALVRHHFVGTKHIDEYYSASQFETDVMALLPSFWSKGNYAVMCGGSMLYVDAVCHGIDDIPDISPEVRSAVKAKLEQEGLQSLLDELQRLDPEYYGIVDRQNTKRVAHAVEICRQTGVTYTSLRTGTIKQRPFNIVKLGIDLDRPTLFDRINRRVDHMMEQGLEQEARSVFHLRHLNALNTVGMKEMFAYFDGTMDFVTARERIKKNTRVYAKKQLTWLARDPAVHWLTAEQIATTDPVSLL